MSAASRFPHLGLRPARAGDASRVADVYLASRKTFLPFAPLAHSDAEVRGWIGDVLVPSGQVTVAVWREEIAGMMAVSSDRGHGWIEQLYLHPAFVGRGFGSRLLEHGLAAAARPVRLYCFAENSAARRFYERHGFVAIEFGDGSANEEGCPDVLYELTAELWKSPPGVQGSGAKG